MSEGFPFLLAAVFVLAAVLELVGVVLAVRVSVRAGRALKRFRALNPEGHAEGTYAQVGAVSGLVDQLLADQVWAWWAVVSLSGGILLGLVGNLATLG